MPNQEQLASAYSAIGIPLDRLPYSEAMDRLVALFNKVAGIAKAAREVWLELIDLRKRGLLPKVGRIRRSAQKK